MRKKRFFEINQDMKRFSKKRILITGAGSGLGRALSLEFARKAWRVGVAEINQQRAAETVSMVNREGGEGLKVICDVTKAEELRKAASIVLEKWDGVDILVNNAGAAAFGLFEKIPIRTWDWILALNLRSVIHGCMLFVPILENQGGGHIVNIASIAGVASLPEMGSYSLTKAGVVSLSETLRSELSPKNIGVTVACPAYFKTNEMDSFTSPDRRQVELADAIRNRSSTILRLLLSGKTAEDVAKDVIRAVSKNRLYVIPQPEGRLLWRMKRSFPESYYKLLSTIYRKGYFDKFFGI